MAHSSMTLRRYLVLLIVAVTAPLGDTFLSVGMKQLGPLSLAHPGMLFGAITNFYVASGILLLLSFFASYTAALSWADLTYVLPTTSIGNVLIALLSRFWLHETITPSRWVGIVFITLGVGFVANSACATDHSPCRGEEHTGAPAALRPSGVRHL